MSQFVIVIGSRDWLKSAVDPEPRYRVVIFPDEMWVKVPLSNWTVPIVAVPRRVIWLPLLAVIEGRLALESSVQESIVTPATVTPDPSEIADPVPLIDRMLADSLYPVATVTPEFRISIVELDDDPIQSTGSLPIPGDPFPEM